MNKAWKIRDCSPILLKKKEKSKKVQFLHGVNKRLHFPVQKASPTSLWKLKLLLLYIHLHCISLFFLLSLNTRKRSWKCQKLLHLPTRAPQILSFLQSRTSHILSLLSSLSKILLPWILALVQPSITSEEYPLMVDATYSTISTVISSKFLESMSLRFVQ